MQAPGGKALNTLARLRGSGRLYAIDRSDKRLDLLRRAAAASKLDATLECIAGELQSIAEEVREGEIKTTTTTTTTHDNTGCRGACCWGPRCGGALLSTTARRARTACWSMRRAAGWACCQSGRTCGGIGRKRWASSAGES